MTNYKTKDSGKRQEYNSGMRRDLQDGKPNLYLWIPKDWPYEEQLLTRIGALATRGAEKYGARNSELANSKEELERFKASAMRHFMQWIMGETDEDHAAAIYFNIYMVEYLTWKLKQKNEKERSSRNKKRISTTKK